MICRLLRIHVVEHVPENLITFNNNYICPTNTTNRTILHISKKWNLK